MEPVLQFFGTIWNFIVQIFQLFVQLVIQILSFFLWVFQWIAGLFS